MENKTNSTPVINPCNQNCSAKNGIIIFAIGVVIGAVITGAAFMIGGHMKNAGHDRMPGQTQMQMRGGMPQQGMPGQNNQQRPSIPGQANDNNSQNNSQ